MKASAWMAVIPILGSLAYADSLADAAKRERERREKQKAASPAPVIREEDLAAGPKQGAKGTYSGAAGSESAGSPAGTSDPSATAPPSGSSRGSGRPAGADATRAAARQRLERAYGAITANAAALIQAVHQYQPCRGAATSDTQAANCQQLLIEIGRLAISVATRMQDAEEAARQGWLSPGEVRDARQRHGMDDAYWDRLVEYVRTYRR